MSPTSPVQDNLKPFVKTDRLRDLIAANCRLLTTISHFGISIGFGDSTVLDVCERQDVDIQTFLTVANFLSQRPFIASAVKVAPLMEYLKGTHTYFLDFFLPSIRRKLIEAVTYGGSDIEVSLLLLRFFDEYVEEISCHMKHENENVFSYIDKLLDNHSHSGHICPNGLFSDKHDDVARKLQELKNIIIGFVPQRDSNMMNSALLDIITCEKEIIDHCAIEDKLFEPAVKRLKKTYMPQNKTADDTDDTAETTETHEKTPQQVETLSAREKEIIRLVACGMSNKEIAERLFLSVHTVTTHRRNLSQKLNIHSSAALTIFAIIHHLVDLDDIRTLNSNGI